MVAHNKIEIAEEARNLQLNIWKHRGEFWPNDKVSPFNCLAPAIAAQYLGYTYEAIKEFGDARFTKGGIVGLLNRPTKKIIVSAKLPMAEQRFTGMHEVGHVLLHKQHKDLDMHRERPVIGGRYNAYKRDTREKEADYFASCFLMPEKLVIEEFKKRFGSKIPLHIKDDVAWWISQNNPRPIQTANKGSLSREMAVASCQTFGHGRIFNSLAMQFNVSISAMAIRLRELNLIKWP